MEANGWHIAFNIPRALLSCFLIGECQWHLFILLSMVWYRPSLCPWSIVWRTEFLLKLQQLDLKNDALKLGNWSLGLVVFKHSNCNSPHSYDNTMSPPEEEVNHKLTREYHPCLKQAEVEPPANTNIIRLCELDLLLYLTLTKERSEIIYCEDKFIF